MSLVEHAVGMWLARMEDDAAVRKDLTTKISRLTAYGIVAFVVFPAIFSLYLSPAIALPVGATLVFAVFLSMAALILLSHKPTRQVTEHIEVIEVGRILPEQLPGAVLHMNENGSVLRVSGRDIKSFPKQLVDCTGSFLVEIVHVSDRIPLMQSLDKLRMGADSVTTDIRFEKMHADLSSQFFFARLDMSADRDNTGRCNSIVAQLTDMNALEELRIEVAAKSAVAVSATEAKSRFLAAVSHELRTPLNAVLGFSDILAGEYFGKLETDRQREYVDLIRQSGSHLLSVVNSMLDMSKLDTGNYELLTDSFSIEDSIASCEAMLSLQAKNKGIKLTNRIQRNIGNVVADERAIQQVLINLASNAIKFTDAGGVVTFEATKINDQLHLVVIDTGIGIAEDKIALLGVPFMQVDNEYSRQYEGTGLGLSLVKGLVDLHGGTFTISSRHGEGTKVTITLPVDGSGVVKNADDITGADMVEFPPRLKKSTASTRVITGAREDDLYGGTKAHIA